jgi:pimeloyl-ACP methyl ester carboxylesterase
MDQRSDQRTKTGKDTVQKTIQTDHCDISVEVSSTQMPSAEKPLVLFIHGNSSCKEVFRHQLASDIGRKFHCVAMDLPGHGDSANASQPNRTYTMQGYADCALQVVSAFNPERFFVVGWSLGGHIGIEMLTMTKDIQGLVISGTPPIGSTQADMQSAFLPNEHMTFTGQEMLSEEQADLYAHTTCGERHYEEFLGAAVRRTDGRARRIMMEAALRGDNSNQRAVVESSPVPLAVINGRQEALVNNDYVASLDYACLWQNNVFLLDNAGHAPFWDEPDQFNALLIEFLEAQILA